MKKLLYFLDNIEKYALCAMFTALVVLVFIQVVARYIFATAWGWMEILTRLLFVYITYIGASWAAKSASHLRVSAGAELLPGKYTKNIFFLFGDCVLVGICAYFGYQLFLMTYAFYLQGVTYTGAKWLPVWVMYFAGVLGFFGITIRTIQGGVLFEIKELRRLKNDTLELGTAPVDETEGG